MTLFEFKFFEEEYTDEWIPLYSVKSEYGKHFNYFTRNYGKVYMDRFHEVAAFDTFARHFHWVSSKNAQALKAGVDEYILVNEYFDLDYHQFKLVKWENRRPACSYREELECQRNDRMYLKDPSGYYNRNCECLSYSDEVEVLFQHVKDWEETEFLSNYFNEFRPWVTSSFNERVLKNLDDYYYDRKYIYTNSYNNTVAGSGYYAESSFGLYAYYTIILMGSYIITINIHDIYHFIYKYCKIIMIAIFHVLAILLKIVWESTFYLLIWCKGKMQLFKSACLSVQYYFDLSYYRVKSNKPNENSVKKRKDSSEDYSDEIYYGFDNSKDKFYPIIMHYDYEHFQMYRRYYYYQYYYNYKYTKISAHNSKKDVKIKSYYNKNYYDNVFNHNHTHSKYNYKYNNFKEEHKYNIYYNIYNHSNKNNMSAKKSDIIQSYLNQGYKYLFYQYINDNFIKKIELKQLTEDNFNYKYLTYLLLRKFENSLNYQMSTQSIYFDLLHIMEDADYKDNKSNKKIPNKKIPNKKIPNKNLFF